MVQLTAEDSREWIVFQSENGIGVYVASMAESVNVFDNHSKEKIFTADVSGCSN
jgi:hypothetical protein